MKKILIILTTFLLLTGCDNNNTDTFKEIDIDETIKTDKYTDNNKVQIGIYEGTNLIKEYNTTLSNFKDIAVFNIYYTNKEKLDSSNIKYNYQKYLNNYENTNNHKNGFYITYEAEGKIIEELILDPKSMHIMAPYLYVYLYDDINQTPGSFYSHLENKDMKDNTIISSIKLFTAHKGTSITSPIILTAFTYDTDDDFTEDNHYRGTSSYTIKINTN